MDPLRLRRSSAIVVVLMAATVTGCVERRYTIRTNPPGALVYVNGQELGTTPVSSSFTYYGDREITLQLDGYETMTVRQPINAPWYDNLLTEFFTENLYPGQLRDERDYTFQLKPLVSPPIDVLRDRAEGLRAVGTIPPPARPKWRLFGWLWPRSEP